MSTKKLPYDPNRKPKPYDPFDDWGCDIHEDPQARSIIHNYCNLHNIGLIELHHLLHMPKTHYMFSKRVVNQLERMLKEPTTDTGEVP